MKRIIIVITSLISLIANVSANSKEWRELTTYKDIKIYAKDENTEGIIPFKAIYTVDINQELLVMSLFNYNLKPTWAPKLKSVKIHREISPTQFIFSEYYTTPWPFYDREFLLEGKVYSDGNTVWLKANSIKSEDLHDQDHVQANVEIIEVAITKIGKNKTLLSFEFVGDMGGMIPTWVINIIQKKWPAKFLLGLEKFSLSEDNQPSAEYLNWRKDVNLNSRN